LKLFAKIDADLVFNFETSPMTQALVSVWYAKKKKIPHYIYVQDLWPENVETVLGIHNKMIIGPINKMVDYIYKNSEKIFVTSESFKRNVESRVSGDDKVIYLPQYAEEYYIPKKRTDVTEISSPGTFKIAFTGNIGYAQGLDILPKVAKILIARESTDIRFVLVGDGRYSEKLVEEIKNSCTEKMFIIIDRQPPQRIPELLAACDAAFVSFMDTPLFAMTIPAKLQSYMACGMPIVASAAGETERIIRESNCGICCHLGDAEELASAILELKYRTDLSEKSQNAREYYEKHFDKKMLMDKLESAMITDAAELGYKKKSDATV
jgi:glycosyltransferase involved in cell wall biosynthesis